MKVNLELEFGDTTCASKPGNFCEMLKYITLGTKPICSMYDEPLTTNEQGWLARCTQCLERWPASSAPKTYKFQPGEYVRADGAVRIFMGYETTEYARITGTYGPILFPVAHLSPYKDPAEKTAIEEDVEKLGKRRSTREQCAFFLEDMIKSKSTWTTEELRAIAQDMRGVQRDKHVTWEERVSEVKKFLDEPVVRNEVVSRGLALNPPEDTENPLETNLLKIIQEMHYKSEIQRTHFRSATYCMDQLARKAADLSDVITRYQRENNP